MMAIQFGGTKIGGMQYGGVKIGEAMYNGQVVYKSGPPSSGTWSGTISAPVPPAENWVWASYTATEPGTYTFTATVTATPTHYVACYLNVISGSALELESGTGAVMVTNSITLAAGDTLLFLTYASAATPGTGTWSVVKN